MKVIRKHIGISFLFLAMLVLFVHAFIPHHHHNKQVCIEKIACTLHDTCSTHPHENDHPHDDANQSCCVLNQLVVIPNNHWKQECSCTAASDKHLHEWVSLIYDNSPTVIHSTDKPRDPVQETVRYFLLAPSSSHLRAPPVV